MFNCMHQPAPRATMRAWTAHVYDMRLNQRTSAPDSYAYYRVCDALGTCRVVRGRAAAQHLIEDIPGLTATKTKLFSPDWINLP